MKQGPFKMKAKSPMLKALIGNQGNLNAGLRAAIKATPEKGSMATMKKESMAKMKKESSMKMMDKKSPTKLTGKERRAAIEEAKSGTYDSPKAKRKAVLEARKKANKAFVAAKKKKVVKAVSNVNEKIQKGAKNLSDKLKSKKKVVIKKDNVKKDNVKKKVVNKVPEKLLSNEARKNKKVDFSKAPPNNTAARRAWYTKNNLKQDDTTRIDLSKTIK